MPQIAQQDNIYLHLSDFGLGDYGLDEVQANDALYNELNKKFNAGVLLDTVIVDSNNASARIIAYSTTREDDNSPWRLGRAYYIADSAVMSLYKPQ